VIDNTYRVERLNGGQLEVTYLPLNIKQTISAGGHDERCRRETHGGIGALLATLLTGCAGYQAT